MDGRHDLSVDPTRLLATSGHAFTMDTTATTHPSGQQLRPPYGDLGRPTAPGDTSTLSAYHSRYLASLPLSTGSSFPFLGSMFTGSLPGPPTSPFRASSTGVNNMRQFWPPTPPPDGYGRYGMNTSLFPLFGSVSPSPDNGTFITQGLVSRLGPTGHLSHLLDSHKEHSFFSPGIGLGSPLTPTSHVTPPTPFPPLIPALERHAGFGHMTLGGKELDESQLVGDAEDVRLMKGHADCLIKQDIPSRHSSNERAKSKAEKHSEKLNSDLHKTSSLSVTKEKHEDVKLTKKADFNKQQQHHQQQLLNKVPPCKIEINSVSASKRDLLSPPAEPLKPEISSPSLVTKKTAISPLPVSVASPHVSTSDCTIQNAIVDVDKSETRCSKCSASLKGVGIATKVNGGSGDCHTDKNPVTEHLPVNSSRVPADRDSTAIAAAAHANHSTLVSTVSTTVAKSVPTGITTVNFSHNFEAASTDSKVCHHTSSTNCPLLTPTSELAPKPTSCQLPNKSAKTGTDGHITPSHSAPGCKHVTAAVIPTAPKQAVQREVHPEPSHTFVCATDNEKLANSLLADVCTVKPESSKHLTDVYNVKAESVKPVVAESCSVKAENIDSATVNNAEKSSIESGQVQLSSSQSNSHKLFGKNIATCCKVKDIIKTVGCSQPLSIETSQNISVSQNNEHDLSNKITHETAAKMPTAPCTTLASAVYPTIVQKVPCFKSGKIQAINVDNRKKLISPKGDTQPLKMEMIASRSDCEYSQKVPASGWTKATVLPFNWQKSGENADELQAINLTVSRKTLKAEPPECSPLSQNVTTGNSTLLRTLPCSNPSAKTTSSENIPLSSSSMVGVCHPNTLISTNKVKAIPHSNSSVSSPALSGSLLNQPDAVTEAHITHRSPKASFPIISRNSTPPVHLKSTLSHVTANASLHNRSLKSERPTTKRSKLAESEKSSHGGRGTLATLAPKLSKTVGFTKDGQTSHTLSTSSSVSSTSIVFPATVNPCIPVGIAIAQQRQDSSSTTAIGKSQSGSSSTAPSIIASATHLAPTRVAAEIQPQPELVRDQKGQEITCSTNPVSADSTNLLVAQGPTIVSRQWESEAVTRTALPSSWVAHGSIVAPAVWLGQGTYAATTGPTSATVPAVPVGSLETSPISLPPGGYQLARDSITGHLFLIPAANIEIVDRTGVWPYSSTPSTLPLQQLVTQHQHTQFEQQVLPQTEAVKIPESTDNSCSIATTCETAVNPNGFKQVDQHVKVEEKPDDTSQVSGVPLASGQTYAFTTFPANCDPSSFSYVLQSSTVMHLAHTQTTAAIQTEPGKRSQGTSPLHCATPSPPPPHNASEQAVQVSVTEDGLEEGEEESDNDSDGVACCESTQVKLSCQSQSVTTAIQVDMDSQTNSEDDDEERKVEMSDSANQTEILLPENLKCESEIEDAVESCEENVKNDENSAVTERKVLDGEDKSQSEPPLEIVESETELAPSLPVESKPVMDFIDHHGLNLLVDSIEEFASREQEALLNSMEKEARSIDEVLNQTHEVKSDSKLISVDLKLETNSNNIVADDSLSSNKEKLDADYKPSYKSIDPSCTDGLGLLCALAEQRFFEEALNTEEPNENNKQTVTLEKDVYDCYSFAEETDLKIRLSYMSPSKDSGLLKPCPNSQSKEPLSPSHSFGSPFHVGSSPETMDPTELEMRLRLAELQRKYKEKQRELARLQPKKDKDNSDIEKNQFKKGPGRPRKRRIFTLPRVKHKPVLSVKATTCFPSHSFKSSGSRLLTKKSLITNTLQKKTVKKVNKSLIANSSFPKLKKKIISSKEKSRSLVKAGTTAGEVMKIPDKIIQNKVTMTAMGLSYGSACKQLKSSSPSKESKNECHVQKLIPKAKLEVPNNSSTIQEAAGKNFTHLQPLLSPTSQSCSFERSKIPSIKITTHDNLKMCSSDKPSTEYQSSQSSKPSNSMTTISSSTNLSLHSDKQTESCKLTQPEKLECVDTSEQVRESHVIKGMKRKAEDEALSERVYDKEVLQVKKLKTESQSISSKQVEKKEEPAFEIITAPETSPKVEKPVPQNTDGTKGDKTKVPFFDEQAWFVRRSERIFLSDARTPVTPQSASNAVTPNSGKKHSIAANGNSTKSDSSAKNTSRSQKLSELSKTPKTAKSQKEVESKKSKNQAVNKFRSKLDEQASREKKRHLSESSTSSSIGSSSEELCPSSSSDSDSSDSSSSQSENLPLSILVEQAAAKAVSSGWCKRLSTDSDSSDFSSGQSEDIPLSILIGQSTVKVELRSCILTPADLQDKTRVLIMDEGLFYAGHITAIQAPDVYGIVLDGERAHRPHIFSREEILNAAVLEVKPTQTLQLPEGSRICAYWSQQYRCLYPGTVAKGKSSSPSVDPSLLYVEFDDGDSGRIPLDDMRMLPPDFPIVSMEPNPLLILGKRRSRGDREHANEQKNHGCGNKGEKCKSEFKKHKSPLKISKKKEEHKESKKENSKPSIKSTNASSVYTSSSCNTSKLSSVDNHGDVKTINIKRKEVSPEKKSQKKNKFDVKIKSKNSEKKKNTSGSVGNVSNSGSSLTLPSKPKKHKKHKDDHKHHHHHHHHHHHRHKKHKAEKQTSSVKHGSSQSIDSTVISVKTVTSLTANHHSDLQVPSVVSNQTHSEKHQKQAFSEMKKPELMVKIKTSPIPEHNHKEELFVLEMEKQNASSDSSSDNSHDSDSSDDENSDVEQEQKKVKKKNKVSNSPHKPAKRKDRLPSVEKSKIAAFLPVRQLWRWSGKSFRRPGAKGKAKKEYYRAIQRGKESIKVGDCAVFLSTGRPHLPYIGRIETMWESWGGKMVVKVKWFYHPEETKSGKKLTQLKGALFQSPHFDENDVQTISHKCEVLSWEEYQRKRDQDTSHGSSYGSLFDNNDIYYLAGTYDPILGSLTMEPGVPGKSVLASVDV